MKLSLYTYVRDGLRLDFHVVPMLRHHLGLADEIIVNEGRSTDGTYEAITAIDPKIQVFQTDWSAPDHYRWYGERKEPARRRCTGDWCLFLDSDEFIPEWQFEPLRAYLASAREDLVPIEMVNFYGNYRVYHASPEAVHWPSRKVAIHRNVPEIEFWGDGSNVRIGSQEYVWPERPYRFSCHHFGFVRHASRLREKWRTQSRMYVRQRFRLPVPSFVFDLLPHRWEDPAYFAGLKPYEGPVIAAVRADPAEFTRDGGALYKRLTGRPLSVEPGS